MDEAGGSNVNLNYNENSIISERNVGRWTGKQVNAYIQLHVYIAYNDDRKPAGAWGGRFEWVDPWQKTKSMGNIFNGYNSFYPPKPGTRVGFYLVDPSDKNRSRGAITSWP